MPTLGDMAAASDEPNGSAPRALNVVAFTMARDEAELLPHWVAYYGGQLGRDHLVVLDDGSDDGSTDDLPCSVLRLPPLAADRDWTTTRLELVNSMAGALLAYYDVAVFTDVDEFLVPDPDRYDGLLHYVSANPHRQVIAPLAVNMLHDADSEAPLDLQRPLLSQRRLVKFAPGMCKPLVKRTGAKWTKGFHGISAPFEIDPGLLMLHMKYCDVGRVQRASQHRNAWRQEGRGGARTSWAVAPDELTALLRSWVASDGADVKELDPAEVDLTQVIRHSKDGVSRSRGGQLTAMEEQPLRRLPDRFRTAF